MRKILWILGLLVMLGALPVVASAQDDASAQGLVAGRGHIVADGDGLALLNGNGWVRLSGTGALRIVDVAGDAEIDVSSGNGDSPEMQTERGRSVMVFRGFDGTAYVSGSHIIVQIRGREIHLEAEGQGRVRLRGGWEVVIDHAITRTIDAGDGNVDLPLGKGPNRPANSVLPSAADGS